MVVAHKGSAHKGFPKKDRRITHKITNRSAHKAGGAKSLTHKGRCATIIL